MCHVGEKQSAEAAQRPPIETPYQGLVFTEPKGNLIPIYHWENKTNSHFYTSDPISAVTLEATEAYVKIGIAWYIYPKRQDGTKTLPLVRWYDPVEGFYRYTASEVGLLSPAPECKREAILGYIPIQDRDTLPTPGTIAIDPDIIFQPTGLFTFDPAFTDEQRYQILQAHSIAYERAGVCHSISGQEAGEVRGLYWVQIHHGIDTNPNNNASTTVGSRFIDVSITNLLSLSKNEIAQTLLHEMLGETNSDTR
ncbi:hypothetical protein PEX2_032580 [Penicillium expansum]|uniref:DUF5648 domain-containing protein n=1 Tax=Penicillium expansum TaxID=27334 RepID=A0A0A2J7C9_PENEN|nr:hypothetical protein PEX2_032580 [Penicillium expansum]KGO51224.1 hypothetical protein PEX2_032580 [Penicillium expansum]